MITVIKSKDGRVHPYPINSNAEASLATLLHSDQQSTQSPSRITDSPPTHSRAPTTNSLKASRLLGIENQFGQTQQNRNDNDDKPAPTKFFCGC